LKISFVFDPKEMIPRRFINLAMKDLRVGGSYWLSRLRPEEKLFYASAREAVAIETRAARMQMCASTRELRLPAFRFKSSRALNSTLGFMPFYGVGGGSSEGRIVVSDSAGHTYLYDAEENSGEMLPPTKEKSNWHSPKSVCIATNAIRGDALYAINGYNSTNFKSLVYCRGDIMSWDWIELPPPPYIFSDKEDPAIQSYTLLEDNKTICFSSASEGFGTYCFDTASLQWSKAGSWTLPFVGRALHVPELYNLHFGFHDSFNENLAVLEFPSSEALARDEPPKVLHHLGGFGPPDQQGEWLMIGSSLLYLGNHRFCAAKFFGIYDGSVRLSENLVDMAVVLTGVEIVDGQADKAKLQMIKHKTKTYIFESCCIEAVF